MATITKSREKVAIKYDEESESYHAFDIETGEKRSGYIALCYGDTPNARDGIADDPKEANKTLGRTGKIDKTAVCVGWATFFKRED